MTLIFVLFKAMEAQSRISNAEPQVGKKLSARVSFAFLNAFIL